MQHFEHFWDIANLDRQNAQKPASPFAQKAILFLQKNATKNILEIGSGRGRDTAFFVQNNLDVTALDLSTESLKLLKKEIPALKTLSGDVSQILPTLQNNSFDGIYARLSLHYFDMSQMQEIFGHIHRILTPKGLLFVENKSMKDFKCGRGEKISDRAYREESINPINYFFTPGDMKMLATDFNILDISESTEQNTDGNQNAYVSLIAQK